jgi:hypothetical protein
MKKVMLAFVVVSSGCGASLQNLKTRAAFDLECNADQMVTQRIDSATQRVDGCGKRAVYVLLFNDARYPTWLLNSEIRDTATAAGH